MKATKDTLLMDMPSLWWHDLWRTGAVSGNGTIGANVYGGVGEETVSLIHNALWFGGAAQPVPDVHEAFAKQRQQMDAGDFKQASWTVVNALKDQGYNARLQALLPLADLKITFNGGQNFTDYQRLVQMDTGEVISSWGDAGSQYASKLFVSRADNVVVKQIQSTDKPLDLSLKLTMHINQGSKRPKEVYQFILDSKEEAVDGHWLYYHATNDDGKVFGAVAKVIAKDAKYTQEPDDLLHVVGSKQVLILVKCFVKADNVQAAMTKEMTALDALAPDYAALLAAHIVKHQALYQSADVRLGQQREDWHSNEQLLLEAYTGKVNPELVEKLWHYSRYLFISGTSENTNPISMYGLWAGDYRVQWVHMMANINIQMIYWQSFVGNLIPLNRGFCNYYSRKIPDFQHNAKQLFGMRGIYMPAGTTPDVSAPSQVVPVIINWVHAAGWIAQHYYRLYQFDRSDKTFLERVIVPYMDEVAKFYEDFVVFTDDGAVKLYPSVSPENTPENFMPPKNVVLAHPMPTTINSTIDIAIVKEFFTNYKALSEAEGINQTRIGLWDKIIAGLPAYRKNADGAIREWQDDRFDDRYDHRHFSHLYPVFPGFEVNSQHNAQLLPAFQRAVDLRKPGAQTGWSMAFMANVYARLGQGDKAQASLANIAKSVLLQNFFTLHNDWRGMNISLQMDPPVQLDALMGYGNAVQEMLFYCADGVIKLLPALGSSMAVGSVRDFRYASGLVSMQWQVEAHQLHATIQALEAHEVIIELPAFVADVTFKRHNCTAVVDGKQIKVSFDREGKLELVTR